MPSVVSPEAPPITDSAISALNENVGLHFFWIEHGIPGETSSRDMVAAEKAADSLDPNAGDQLAIELCGFDPDMSLTPDFVRSNLEEAFGYDVAGIPTSELIGRAAQRQLFGSFEIAAFRAVTKGVITNAADIDQSQLEAWNRYIAQRGRAILKGLLPAPIGRYIATEKSLDQLDDLREGTAIHRLGRIALKVQRPLRSRRPNLAVLWGVGHQPGFETRLGSLGIQFQSTRIAAPPNRYERIADGLWAAAWGQRRQR